VLSTSFSQTLTPNTPGPINEESTLTPGLNAKALEIRKMIAKDTKTALNSCYIFISYRVTTLQHSPQQGYSFAMPLITHLLSNRPMRKKRKSKGNIED
jgi:hypothetical protein